MNAPRFAPSWAAASAFVVAFAAAPAAFAQASSAPAPAPAAPGAPSAEAPAAANAPSTTAGAEAAQPTPQALKEAGERYTRGLSLYSGGEYLLALVEFERAYQLAPNYRVLYNVGQVRIQLARYSKAREALEEYLKQGGDEINAERRKAVEADLQMLAERTAKLSIVSNEPAAEISLDGFAIGITPLAEPVVVDAGEHSVEVRKNGYYGKTTRVTLAGRDDLEVRLDITKIPESKAVVVQGPTTAQRPEKSLVWVGWATTGALAVGAGVVGYLGVTKANDLESMRTDYGVSRQQLDDTKNSARTLFMISDIAGAAAVLVGGASLYFTLANNSSSNTSGPEKAPAPQPAKPKVGFGVTPYGVRVSGAF
ncbi:MAG: PEGA domain-containing protein [Polyangiaceae bacterium]